MPGKKWQLRADKNHLSPTKNNSQNTEGDVNNGKDEDKNVEMM